MVTADVFAFTTSVETHAAARTPHPAVRPAEAVPALMPGGNYGPV
jgi:hypothetical protein